jgi:predicted DNA-binding protein (MmcQ/YjbR family)
MLTQVDIDTFRELCLSFPHATEKLQWGEELCFKVGAKIFAMIALSAVPQSVVFKCNPESFAELTEREGITPAPYVGRYKWVRLEQLDVIPAFELQDLVRQSYEMVATKAAVGRKPVRKQSIKRRRRA